MHFGNTTRNEGRRQGLPSSDEVLESWARALLMCCSLTRCNSRSTCPRVGDIAACCCTICSVATTTSRSWNCRLWRSAYDIRYVRIIGLVIIKYLIDPYIYIYIKRERKREKRYNYQINYSTFCEIQRHILTAIHTQIRIHNITKIYIYNYNYNSNYNYKLLIIIFIHHTN